MDAIIRNIKEHIPEHYHKLSETLDKDETASGPFERPTAISKTSP